MAPDLDVVRTAATDGDARVRQIRNGQEPLRAQGFDRFELCLEGAHARGAFAIHLLLLRRVLTLAPGLRDGLAGGVLFPSKALHLRQHLPTPRLEFGERLELGGEIFASLAQSRANGIKVIPDQCRVQHGVNSNCVTMGR